MKTESAKIIRSHLVTREMTTSNIETRHQAHATASLAAQAKRCIWSRLALTTLVLLASGPSLSYCRTTAATITEQSNLDQSQANKQSDLVNPATVSDRPPMSASTGNSLVIISNFNSLKGEPKLAPATLPIQTVQQLCQLGNDTYQLGERWNPNLPPFGVQVCVLCECMARQDKRKNCYEAKVTCRRITNECPKIDSCPDGKRPVTIAGQCCKSCQSANYSASSDGASGLVTEATLPQAKVQAWAGQSTEQPVSTSTSMPTLERNQLFAYKNDRVKEYQAIVKSLPACQRRDESDKHQLSLGGSRPTKGKTQKPNDLNGIDSRLAFKSLDQQNAYHSLSEKGQNRNQINRPIDDIMRQDHQHPNDVQSGAGSQQQHYDESRFSSSPDTQQQQTDTATRRNQTMTSSSVDSCTLGTEMYEVGHKWNPILPQLGVQVCVLCNCIIRQRKGGCYEAKVTCRRINNDCPIIEVCPDGKKPIAVVGQCCKSCQDSDQGAGVIITATATTKLPELTQRNDTVLREYQLIMKTYPACNRLREGEKNTTATVKRSFNLRKRRGEKYIL